MVRSARESFGRPRGLAGGSASGFTLIELLVVIGILALLMGLLVPMIMKAFSKADTTAMAADLQQISTALEAYKADFGDYPRPVDGAGASGRGAQLLAWALVAPGDDTADGVMGPGFKAGLGKKVYGPYLDMTHFKLNSSATVFGDPINTVILDRAGNPIVYLPADSLHGKVNRANGNAYFDAKVNFVGNYTTVPALPADHMLFNLADFPQLTATGSVTASAKFYAMLGDTNLNGSFDNAETPAYTGPFILWSAGSDGIYGPDISAPDPLTIPKVAKCDDVLNIPR